MNRVSNNSMKIIRINVSLGYVNGQEWCGTYLKKLLYGSKGHQELMFQLYGYRWRLIHLFFYIE